MEIRKASNKDIRGFIDCYIDIWKSLQDILPTDYVNDQVEKAYSSTIKNELLAEISDSNYIILVAKENAEIIGLAWGNIRKDGSSWLSLLGVSQEHRRKGVGKSLLTRFIEESREKGSPKISFDTDPRLVPAIRLYENMDFVPEGYTKNPYGLELIIYSKEII
jgi:ribosomal protein S18 acetylase RimI-like enzyme